jgi:hypothetical protein
MSIRKNSSWADVFNVVSVINYYRSFCLKLFVTNNWCFGVWPKHNLSNFFCKEDYYV